MAGGTNQSLSLARPSADITISEHHAALSSPGASIAFFATKVQQQQTFGTCKKDAFAGKDNPESTNWKIILPTRQFHSSLRKQSLPSVSSIQGWMRVLWDPGQHSFLGASFGEKIEIKNTGAGSGPIGSWAPAHPARDSIIPSWWFPYLCKHMFWPCKKLATGRPSYLYTR